MDLLNNRLSLFREGTEEGYRRESEDTELERLKTLTCPRRSSISASRGEEGAETTLDG